MPPPPRAVYQHMTRPGSDGTALLKALVAYC
jgi:hypothetical protein